MAGSTWPRWTGPSRPSPSSAPRNQYRVTATETITLVRSIPNRNDDGVEPVGDHPARDRDRGDRHGPEPGDLCRVVRPAHRRRDTGDRSQPRHELRDPLAPEEGAGWLAEAGSRPRPAPLRGEPHRQRHRRRPGDQHAAHRPGGNTNKGAPSHNFALLPEFALSAAIISVDLGAIGSSTYDLPTLDDDGPGSPDANDPFGGNDGKNQARLVPGGPVQIYAPGFRNPYDLVVTESGNMYTIDNGGNAGWGGPAPGRCIGTCTNDPFEPSDSDRDPLIRIPEPGFYGGHPNPTRASRANTFNATNPQSPVSSSHPVECDYRTEAERGAMASFAFSTNGLDEYTASNFGGAMQGDLLAASHNDTIYRIQLNADGTRPPPPRSSSAVSTAWT